MASVYSRELWNQSQRKSEREKYARCSLYVIQDLGQEWYRSLAKLNNNVYTKKFDIKEYFHQNKIQKNIENESLN